MKHLISSLFLLATLFSTLTAQKLKYKTLEWEEKPVIHTLDESYDDESAVIINDYRCVQVALDYNKAYTYATNHKIIKVNTDAGIEKFNKIYIPISNGDVLIRIELRTISPDNGIKKFNSGNLRKLNNVDGYSNYNIYAVEGIEKGCEIEYIYTIKKNVQSIGREIFQRDVPIIKAKFELLTPDRIEYSTKSYNGFPDSRTYNSNKETVEAENIPALTDEGFSSYKAKLMRVDYKIERSYLEHNLITWGSVARNLFRALDTSKGSKQAAKFIKSLDFDDQSELIQIQMIEEKIKKEFSIKESLEDEYSNPAFIFKNKVGNSFGICKVYMKCFERLELDFQIVFTSSRIAGTLDADYAHNMDLRDILFYFPRHKKYISPELIHMRLGPPSNVHGGNLGLFISTAYSEFPRDAVYKMYQIKTLPYLTSEENNLGMNVNVKLNESLDEASLKVEQFSQGHRAYFQRFMYSVSEEDEKEEFKKSTVTSAIEDAVYTSTRLENEDVSLSTDNSKYFNVHVECTSKSLVEKVGNDILFSIGKVIGKQIELYEEKERTTDVIFYDLKRYSHRVVFEIPEGYKCSGLDNLKISNSLERDGKTIMRFISDYSIEGNQLIVTINEDYHVLEIDKSLYNEYRKVINSAADFNKVVIVLEPK